ncbi:hypothetical protein NRZ28_03330 [Aeromonas hydrophila]|uniref:hypothetical protein n=1 Tax=Aeromonas hydrophila TaxID=644 RepID=UPI00227A4A63|nr:hypothetical protein [Aeromonas hydrophila]WAF91305.1 hypothetical protein NRZ33_03350 [Aeromonas hydrophila]WAG04023.1 hypothetical protein NRZ28_03330 [Aeromonas hydrophila]
MWKVLKWFFIGWALLLILSDLQITTSLYKYEDNRVVVNFPRWQADQPWGTFEWHAGRVEADWYGLAGRPKQVDPLL